MIKCKDYIYISDAKQLFVVTFYSNLYGNYDNKNKKRCIQFSAKVCTPHPSGFLYGNKNTIMVYLDLGQAQKCQRNGQNKHTNFHELDEINIPMISK